MSHYSNILCMFFILIILLSLNVEGFTDTELYGSKCHRLSRKCRIKLKERACIEDDPRRCCLACCKNCKVEVPDLGPTASGELKGLFKDNVKTIGQIKADDKGYGAGLDSAEAHLADTKPELN